MDLKHEIDKARLARMGSQLPAGEAQFGQCEHCKSMTIISQQVSRTAYAADAQNLCPRLCADCAAEYHDYWDEMWSNVPGY